MKTLTWSALVLGLAAASGCSFASPYGASKESSSHSGSDGDHAASAGTAATDPDGPSAASTEAAPLADAGPTESQGETGCAAQTVTWTVGASSCAADASRLEESATQGLGDSTVDDTGSVTVSCFEGKLTLTNAVCEPPKEIDVGSSSGCGTGFCAAVVSGHCGQADPAKADAVCVAKGYAAATAYTTMPGPNGGRECHADGTGCFTNANSSCNIVFKTVTCRH